MLCAVRYTRNYRPFDLSFLSFNVNSTKSNPFLVVGLRSLGKGISFLTMVKIVTKDIDDTQNKGPCDFVSSDKTTNTVSGAPPEFSCKNDAFFCAKSSTDVESVFQHVQIEVQGPPSPKGQAAFTRSKAQAIKHELPALVKQVLIDIHEYTTIACSSNLDLAMSRTAIRIDRKQLLRRELTFDDVHANFIYCYNLKSKWLSLLLKMNFFTTPFPTFKKMTWDYICGITPISGRRICHFLTLRQDKRMNIQRRVGWHKTYVTSDNFSIQDETIFRDAIAKHLDKRLSRYPRFVRNAVASMAYHKRGVPIHLLWDRIAISSATLPKLVFKPLAIVCEDKYATARIRTNYNS